MLKNGILSSKIQTKQECLLLTLLFNIALEVIASETIQKKKRNFKEEMPSFFHRWPTFMRNY